MAWPSTKLRAIYTQLFEHLIDPSHIITEHIESIGCIATHFTENNNTKMTHIKCTVKKREQEYAQEGQYR